MTRLRPDWRQYFLDFCTRHGTDPVELDGRLVFRDGWGYARADYRGPEFAPPTSLEDLYRLQVRYWARRRDILTKKRDQLMADMESLAVTQMNRDAPIPVHGTTSVEGSDGRLYLVSAPLEVRWDDLKLQLSSICLDVDEASRNLRELEGL